jgi:hypothetical protein
MDGYPSGHGKELAEFMAGITFVNGYTGEHHAGTHANGGDCFAAQLVGKLKAGKIGHIYLRNHDCEGEEYNYTVTISRKDGGRGPWDHVDFIERVKCEGHGKGDSYDGDLAGFVEFCNKKSHHDED